MMGIFQDVMWSHNPNLRGPPFNLLPTGGQVKQRQPKVWPLRSFWGMVCREGFHRRFWCSTFYLQNPSLLRCFFLLGLVESGVWKTTIRHERYKRIDQQQSKLLDRTSWVIETTKTMHNKNNACLFHSWKFIKVARPASDLVDAGAGSLITACREGEVEQLMQLLSSGISPDAPDADGQRPLILYCATK